MPLSPPTHIPVDDLEPTICEVDDFEATDVDDFEEAKDEEDLDCSRKAFSSRAAAAAKEALRLLAAIADA